MRTTLLASLLIGFATGCVAPLNPCVWDEDQGIVLNRAECPDRCYVDADGDGAGSEEEPILLGVGEDCEGPNRADVGGDCNDADDNNFPGNVEVCDGRDNDCNDSADFDAEEEHRESDDPNDDDYYQYSCTPLPSVRVFVRGGSVLNGQPFSGRDNEVLVYEGDPLVGELKLEVHLPPSLRELIGAGFHLPGEGEHRDAFEAIWDPVAGNLADDHGVFPIEIEFDGSEFVPAADEDTELAFLSVAAGFGGKLDSPEPLFALSAQHLGALTDPVYCCDDCPGDPAPCPPLWDPPGQLGEIDQDLADLDDLDFAACRTFGNARLPFLVAGLDGDQERCEFVPAEPGEPQPEGDCVPILSGVEVGCASVGLRIETRGEDG